MMLKVWISTFVLVSAIIGCSTDAEYDPDWAPMGPLEDGKADGLVDYAPRLELGATLEGEVSGDNMELFRIELSRTDRIRIAMEVLDGDLNPHISLFYGTSTYIHSESWARDGDVLSKEYLIESSGIYFVAARAYLGEGSGRYSLTATCLGGPCAGELPPPNPDEEEYTVSDIVDCIAQARRCAFSRLDRYDGAVGEVRSHLLFNECLAEASMWDDSSCASACEWEGDEEDRDWDDAAPLCEDIIQSLPFYADQSALCLSFLENCMVDCYDINSDYDFGEYDEISFTVETLCWVDGFNGTCDGLARSSEHCGGTIPDGSAEECLGWCESTIGAFIDDLDMICYEEGCESSCDEDLANAAETCGELSDETEYCYHSYLDSRNILYFCEDEIVG